ncbi:hypothetical protein SAMN05660484_00480 [Eubacterium ruminantium]|uniref:Uncharacterized protein n=1 Tax=Eubacterium ruminantium TaxID=42322 RepID=A0A1T4KKI4_9FIRM|nr:MULTISPECIES: hypothetical protein [Eubacterium]MCR5367051.1 hypothetical protein [Eubacterium sp.]SCW32855.1 hypothetical protein SAMN05660484_00480 [Eubacterium ruminantium]SDM29159.1 hypothetical protein SAMN04490370_102142 [Eubacterium ruminantium]SJZ42919.1 hypothetical protein SAMN02745110_00435 [Eubacterium ruminantium]
MNEKLGNSVNDEEKVKRYNDLLAERYELLMIECPIIDYKYWDKIENMQAEVFRKKLKLLELTEEGRDFSNQYKALSKMEEKKAEVERRYKDACHLKEEGKTFSPEKIKRGEDLEKKIQELTEEIKQIKTSYPYNKRFIVNSPRAVARHRERLQLLIDEYDKEIEECYIKIRSQKN